MGLFDKLTQAAAGLQAQQMAVAQKLAGKQSAMLGALGNPAAGKAHELRLTPQEVVEIRALLDGALPELSALVGDARRQRLESLRAASMPNLGWCLRCTRIHTGEPDCGIMFALQDSVAGLMPGCDHRCTDFTFPEHDGHCVDCAIQLGATVPCVISGEMFAPRVDKAVSGFGHTIVSPAVEEVLKNGGVINADRTIRDRTPGEVEAETGVAAAKQMFKTCPVDIKPRIYFIAVPNPHWILGHYVRIRAEVMGLEAVAGGYDTDGTYYARVDNEGFQIKVLQGRIEIDMAVDPETFSPERASAAGAAFAGAISGGAHRASWGMSGKSIAAGAAFGAVQGLMAAGEEKRRADAARDRAIVAYVGQTFETLGQIAKSELASSQPPILGEAGRVPQRAKLTTWPTGIDVGRAAARLAKQPLG